MTAPLRPSQTELLSAWRARVRADRKQVERAREVEDPADFYAPMTGRFRMDPRRTDDATVNSLLALAEPSDVWLDVGSGAGRYALPLALAVREVVAIDPSPAMLAALAEDAAAAGIGNIHAMEARWPMDAGAPKGDVALMAHVGYDIEAIGPFLDALEAAAARLCVAVLGESAMATVASLFWKEIHGEPRVRLPALPELLDLLAARGRSPQIRYVDRIPPTFAGVDEAIEMARRQLWLRRSSSRDFKMRHFVADAVTERDGRFAFEWQPTKIGIVSWLPR